MGGDKMTVKKLTEIAAVVTTALALAIAIKRVIDAVREASDED